MLSTSEFPSPAMRFKVSTNTLRLWNGSWADDSVRWDEVNRVAYEPSRIKKIEHNGKELKSLPLRYLLTSNSGTHLKLSARHQLHPSPQRTPVIFQAGTSKSGMAFAARHAEAIYIGGMVPSQATAQIKVSSHMSSALSSLFCSRTQGIPRNSSIRRPGPHHNEVLRSHISLHRTNPRRSSSQVRLRRPTRRHCRRFSPILRLH